MFSKFIYILIIVLLLAGATISFAQNSATISGQQAPPAPEWAKAQGGFMTILQWLFPFMIAAAVIIATLSIIYAGFEWMAGAISPPQIESAKNRIYAAVLGLAVALGSWLILNTISPTFIKLKAPVGFTLECQGGVCPSWTDVLFGAGTEPSVQEAVKRATVKEVPASPNITGGTPTTMDEISRKLRNYGKTLVVDSSIDTMNFGTEDLQRRQEIMRELNSGCTRQGGAFGPLSSFPGVSGISGSSRYYICVK